jgi:serine/threonine protein kinase
MSCELQTYYEENTELLCYSIDSKPHQLVSQAQSVFKITFPKYRILLSAIRPRTTTPPHLFFPYLIFDSDDTLKSAIKAFRHLATDPTKSRAIPEYLIIYPRDQVQSKYFPEVPSFFVKPVIAPLLKPLEFIQEFPGWFSKGGYASVTKATYKTKSDSVKSRHLSGDFARKVISVAPKNDKLENLREAYILIEVDHPCLLKLLGVSLDRRKGSPILLTKFYRHASLSHFLLSPEKSLDPTQKMIMIYGIAHGMDYLHSRRIVHRDLNPGNVLVDEISPKEYRPVICDFGISKRMMDGSIGSTNHGGKPRYVAPEITDGTTHSWEVDRYNFGELLCDLLDIEIPSEDQQYEVDPFAEIIRELKSIVPRERPFFGTVLERIEKRILMLPGVDYGKVMDYAKELRKLEPEFLDVKLENYTEQVRRSDVRTVEDLARIFAPHLLSGQFRMREQSSMNRILSFDKCIFRCEKRKFEMEFAAFVVVFSCGDTMIPIVTESRQIADFRKLLFPKLKESIKIDFYEKSKKIKDTQYLRALDLRQPITITAKRLFTVSFEESIERIPFSQWSKVKDLKRAFASRHCCSIDCLIVTSTEEPSEIFQNGTVLWDLPDKLMFILENDPSVIIIIDEEIEKVAASQTVSDVIKSLELKWIKGNGSELCDNLVLLNVPDEMILTASRKSEKIYVQAGTFEFEFSTKHLPVTSETFRSIVAKSILRVPPNAITPLEGNQRYQIQNIPIRMKITGFFQEFTINAELFWSVGELQKIVEEKLETPKCVLTFLCRRLDREKPLSFYGIENDSELRVIQDPTISVVPESLVALISWKTLPGEGIPFIFVMPDLRLIVWRFQLETTLQEAGNVLKSKVGNYPVGFRVKSEVQELTTKFEFLPTTVLHLFIILDTDESTERNSQSTKH